MNCAIIYLIKKFGFYLPMSTKKDFAVYVLDQVNDKKARVKAMFGEYALYYNEKVVALICDNKVFLKITKGTKEILGNHKIGKAYPNSSDFFVLGEEILEDSANFRKTIKWCAAIGA